jgi:hypothetical protein
MTKTRVMLMLTEWLAPSFCAPVGSVVGTSVGASLGLLEGEVDGCRDGSTDGGSEGTWQYKEGHEDKSAQPSPHLCWRVEGNSHRLAAASARASGADSGTVLAETTGGHWGRPWAPVRNHQDVA